MEVTEGGNTTFALVRNRTSDQVREEVRAVRAEIDRATGELSVEATRERDATRAAEDKEAKERRRKRKEEDASPETLTYDDLRERKLKRAAQDRQEIDTGLANYETGDRCPNMPQPKQKMLEYFDRGEQEGLWAMVLNTVRSDVEKLRIEADMTRFKMVALNRKCFNDYQDLVLNNLVGPDNVLCSPLTGLPTPIDRFYSRLGYVENQRRKAAGKPLLVKSAMLGSADRFDNTLSHVDVDQKLMWLPRAFQFSPQMQGPMTTEQIVTAVFGEEHTAASEADMKDMEVIMKSQPFITWVKHHLHSK